MLLLHSSFAQDCPYQQVSNFFFLLVLELSCLSFLLRLGHPLLSKRRVGERSRYFSLRGSSPVSLHLLCPINSLHFLKILVLLSLCAALWMKAWNGRWENAPSLPAHQPASCLSVLICFIFLIASERTIKSRETNLKNSSIEI